MISATVTERENRMREAAERIDRLIKRQILVGITEETAGATSGPINNAVKAYINDQGAPEANIPQREFMRPGIESARDEIIPALKKAAVKALHGDEHGALAAMDAAGGAARDGIREEIDSGPLADAGRQLSEVTLRLRKQGRPGRAPINTEEPLKEQQEMYQAITYVIED